MREMVDALLRLAEYGYRALEMSDVNMTDLAKEVLDFHLLGCSGTPVDVNIGQLPNASVDRALFRHVWDNLLGNALKYSRKRETPTIWVEAQLTPDGVEYSVRDNGVGFDARYAGDIFRPFQRVCEPEFEGLGIGLALVERVVQRHGGAVGAHGQLDVGARLWFTLPHRPGPMPRPLSILE